MFAVATSCGTYDEALAGVRALIREDVVDVPGVQP